MIVNTSVILRRSIWSFGSKRSTVLSLVVLLYPCTWEWIQVYNGRDDYER